MVNIEFSGYSLSLRAPNPNNLGGMVEGACWFYTAAQELILVGALCDRR